MKSKNQLKKSKVGKMFPIRSWLFCPMDTLERLCCLGVPGIFVFCSKLLNLTWLPRGCCLPLILWRHLWPIFVEFKTSTAEYGWIRSLISKLLSFSHRWGSILAKGDIAILLCTISLLQSNFKCSTGPDLELLGWRFEFCGQILKNSCILEGPSQKRLFFIKQGGFERNGSKFDS